MQCIRQPLRAAEPDFGKSGRFHTGNQCGGFQHFALTRTMHLQADTGQALAKVFKVRHVRIIATIPRAVVQIGIYRCYRMSLQVGGSPG